MIRHFIHIILLLAGSVLLSARSCGPDVHPDQESKLMAEQDRIRKEIKEDFNAEYLFEGQLMAYNEKARQKVLDLAEYLSLYSDKKLDTLFRHQVKEMIYKLFYPEDALVEIGLADSKHAAQPIRLNDLLMKTALSDYQSLVFEVSELRTVEPLHNEGLQQYDGVLVCRIRISGIVNRDTVSLQESVNTVNVKVVRKEKPFGAGSSMPVWQVYLSGVECTLSGLQVSSYQNESILNKEHSGQ